jgi:hypothetical protein
MVKSIRHSFSDADLHEIVVAYFGNPPNYFNPCRSIGSVSRLLKLR